MEKLSPAAAELVQNLKKAHTFEQIGSLLSWDTQVNMPAESGDARSDQEAVIATLRHQASTNPAIAKNIAAIEALGTAATDDEKALARLARKDYEQLTRLPESFVAEKAAFDTASYEAWHKARATNDFAAFAPFLEKQVAYARQKAHYLNPTGDTYDTLLDQYDPDMTQESFSKLAEELQTQLVPLVREILSSPIKADESFLKGFPVPLQAEFLKKVTTAMGFDYGRGRFDISPHPFCSGDAFDSRLTTRYHEDNPLDSLFSAIHETGHALYEQGLPREWVGTPLGTAVGMGIHESQSRLWENQVARSHAFWKYFETPFREHFAPRLNGVSSEALYLAINKVSPTLIRCDSDEVTYNLHVLLRFQMEKELISGTLPVAEVPRRWNQLSTELLGLTPPNDTQGCLQDVHWSDGSFGYFPSYCLGNMVAAQLWNKVRQDLPALDENFSEGNFAPLLGWLRQNIHAHGRRYGTQELVQKVTGEPIRPQYLVAYLKDRYLPLYTTHTPSL